MPNLFSTVPSFAAGAEPFPFLSLLTSLSLSSFAPSGPSFSAAGDDDDGETPLSLQTVTASLPAQPLSFLPSPAQLKREERNTKESAKMVGFACTPRWLEALLGEKFFSPCLIHESAKKNEKNIYCLDCCSSICPHCLSPHRSHRLLQIRRYVYHDVVRLDDLEKLFDCSSVQSYTTNNAKVVFLNERPQSRPFRGSGNLCSTCDRSLQDPYLFCSIACKVQYLLKTEGGLSKYLYECEFLALGDSCCYELEDGQMTPDSILESPDSFQTSSGSSASGGTVCRTLVCTATTEFVKKKRSSVSGSRASFRPICSPATDMAAHMNRRKGVPNRSPLY